MNGTTEILLNSQVKLYLNEEQIVAFKYFQDYYADLVILIDSGVFSFKHGRAVIHRDKEGKLREVNLELTRFKS